MTDPTHDHENGQSRGTDDYCGYCGATLPADRQADRPTRTDGGFGATRLDRAFCDADCESMWNIDATQSTVEP